MNADARPDEGTGSRECLNFVDGAQVHRANRTWGRHPEQDEGRLAYEDDIPVPQEERPDDCLWVASKGCGGNDPGQDADSVSACHRPVGLTPDVAMTVNTRDSAALDLVLKGSHVFSCRRRPRNPSGNVRSVDK